MVLNKKYCACSKQQLTNDWASRLVLSVPRYGRMRSFRLHDRFKNIWRFLSKGHLRSLKVIWTFYWHKSIFQYESILAQAILIILNRHLRFHLYRFNRHILFPQNKILLFKDPGLNASQIIKMKFRFSLSKKKRSR